MISKQAKENARKRLPFRRLTGLWCATMTSNSTCQHEWLSIVDFRYHAFRLISTGRPQNQIWDTDRHLDTFKWILNSEWLNRGWLSLLLGTFKEEKGEGWIHNLIVLTKLLFPVSQDLWNWGWSQHLSLCVMATLFTGRQKIFTTSNIFHSKGSLH